MTRKMRKYWLARNHLWNFSSLYSSVLGYIMSVTNRSVYGIDCYVIFMYQQTIDKEYMNMISTQKRKIVASLARGSYH